MKIAVDMPLDRLAEHMGAGATAAQATEMRDLLIEEGWDGKSTTDLPQDLWVRMVEAARRADGKYRPHRR